MKNEETNQLAYRMFDAIENMIPSYMEDPADKKISNGNVAACIIDENGVVHVNGYVLGIHFKNHSN